MCGNITKAFCNITNKKYKYLIPMDEKNSNNIKNNDEQESELVKSLRQEILTKDAMIHQLQLKLKKSKQIDNISLPHPKPIKTTDCSKTVNDQNVKGKYPILSDIFCNTANKTKNYDEKSYQLSSDIRSICPKAHEMLVKECNFPSNYLLNKKFNDNFSELFVIEFLLNN